jgi:hypothetical protein
MSTIDVVRSILDSGLAKFVGGLIAAYVVYRLGLNSYFRQKEYEHVRSRYLDHGFDALTAEVEYALSVYRTNWTLVLRYTKLYRDIERPLDVADFFHQFREFDQEHFRLVPAHRLKSLLQDDTIWNGYQRVVAFVNTTNDMIKADFGVALRVLSSRATHPDKESFVQKADSMAKEMHGKSTIHYDFLSELQNLARLFEAEQFSRTSLVDFKSREAVKTIMSRLATLYPNE